MTEQLEEEYSEDRRSPKKQRVDDDANERDEENQRLLEHLPEPRVPWRDTYQKYWKRLWSKCQKSVQELVGKYSQEIVKSVDTLIRPSLLETVKQSVEKSIENALAKTVNEAVEEALKRYNDKWQGDERERKLDGEWVYQEGKGKGAKENQRNSVNLSSTSSTPLRQKKVSDLGICDREI
eukprot:g70983.t1